ncbi:MAG: TM2 domain-containing protein [Akkermansiaceae bacterium]
MSDDQQQPPAENNEQPPPPEAPAAEAPPQQPQAQPGVQIPGADKKLLAGLLGIFLGWVGAHKFVLGYQQEGTILAIVGSVSLITSWIPIVGCITIFGLMGTSIVGLIEGIIYLTKSDQEFVDTYVTKKKAWF